MVLGAHIDFAAWLSLAGVVIAMVAAAATLAAVYFAFVTVRESEAANKAAWARHREQVDKMEAASEAVAKQHQQQVSELQFVASSAHAGAEEQMRLQEEVFARELVLRRIEYMSQLAETSYRLLDTVHNEIFNPRQSTVLDVQTMETKRVPVTRIPQLQGLLRFQVTALAKIGGPDLSPQLPRSAGDQPRLIISDAIQLLVKLEDFVAHDESLRLP